MQTATWLFVSSVLFKSRPFIHSTNTTSLTQVLCIYSDRAHSLLTKKKYPVCRSLSFSAEIDNKNNKWVNLHSTFKNDTYNNMAYSNFLILSHISLIGCTLNSKLIHAWVYYP